MYVLAMMIETVVMHRGNFSPCGVDSLETSRMLEAVQSGMGLG